MLFGPRESMTDDPIKPTLVAKSFPLIYSINSGFDPIPTDIRFSRALDGNDIVHLHGFGADLLGLLSFLTRLKNKRLKLLVTDYGWNGLTLIRILRKLPVLSRLGNFQLLPLTRFSFSRYRAYVKVYDPIYGGVDTKFFRPVDIKRRNSVIFSGRIAPHKGIENLVKAVSQIQRMPDLIITGPVIDHNYYSFLRDLVKKVSVNADFPGPISDDQLVRYYSSSMALVLPSVYFDMYGKYHPQPELFGLVLAEAMACQLPVIASRVGGIPEIIRNGVTGFLTEPGNVSELRDKLELLLDDPTTREALGLAGRQEVLEKFTWHHVARRCLVAYEDALS
ncbi:glycosyltransferase family 4 protein [Candidatus Bathyarchaeota archaeon]|nr:MAG: glycosyltransferase family 4 protein [Candidatus Bathyarchaeota archaeon]